MTDKPKCRHGAVGGGQNCAECETLRCASLANDPCDCGEMTEAQVDAAIRALGGDPDAIGRRGEALARDLLARPASIAGVGR